MARRLAAFPMQNLIAVIGSRWLASWSVGRPDAFVWTVRGVTEHGVYITAPGTRVLGSLIPCDTFRRMYVPVPNANA